MMENRPKFDWRDSFQEAADNGEIERLDAQIIADSRRKFESGEILQESRYRPLPNNPQEAFRETSIRESVVINKAVKKLGERRNI